MFYPGFQQIPFSPYAFPLMGQQFLGSRIAVSNRMKINNSIKKYISKAFIFSIYPGTKNSKIFIIFGVHFRGVWISRVSSNPYPPRSTANLGTWAVSCKSWVTWTKTTNRITWRSATGSVIYPWAKNCGATCRMGSRSASSSRWAPVINWFSTRYSLYWYQL